MAFSFKSATFCHDTVVLTVLALWLKLINLVIYKCVVRIKVKQRFMNKIFDPEATHSKVFVKE